MRFLQREAEERNHGDYAIGVDTVGFGFVVHDVQLDHPLVRWAMYSDGSKEQVTTEEWSYDPAELLASDLDLDSLHWPLEELWRARPAAAVDITPKAVRGKLRRRERPVAKYIGTIDLDRRTKVKIVVTYFVGWCWANVSFSAARFHDPAGYGTCPPHMVEPYVTALIARLTSAGVLTRLCPHVLQVEAANVSSTSDSASRACIEPDCLRVTPSLLDGADSPLLTQAEELRGVKITRIDVACDFHRVHDQSLYLDIMRSSRFFVPRPDADDQSVMLKTGNSGWRMRGYDKHREAMARRQGVEVPEGTFRFEVELHAAVLKRFGVRYALDLTEEVIRMLWLRGFVKAGLDQAVGGQSPVRRRSLPGVGRTRTSRLYRLLDALAVGESWPAMDPATRRAYRRLAAQHGFVLGRPTARLGPHRHLDPVAGVEKVPSEHWMQLHEASRWHVRSTAG